MADKAVSRRDFLRGAAAAGLMATGSLLGITSASAEELPSVYTPGTYTATAPGFGGDVTVTLTVDETSILEATIDAPGETESIGQAAAKELAQQIMERQSFEIDAVSGASNTSRAVRQALESCVAQAKGVDVSLLQASASAEEAAPVDWLGEAPVIDEAEVVETIETEVLVIGAGTAGLFAACAAVEEGAKTATPWVQSAAGSSWRTGTTRTSSTSSQSSIASPTATATNACTRSGPTTPARPSTGTPTG